MLMTSGYIDPQDQMSATRLGVRAILTKPVSRKELLQPFMEFFKGASNSANRSLGKHTRRMQDRR